MGRYSFRVCLDAAPEEPEIGEWAPDDPFEPRADLVVGRRVQVGDAWYSISDFELLAEGETEGLIYVTPDPVQ